MCCSQVIMFIVRVHWTLEFSNCTAALKISCYIRCQDFKKKKKKDRRSLTHTLNSQVDLALSFLGLFAWREVRSSDGDGSFRVFTDPLQSFFRCHLPPGSLREGRKGRFYKPFFVCFMFRGRNKILWDSWLLISRDKKHKTLSLSICHLKDKPLSRTKSICIEHKHFAKN